MAKLTLLSIPLGHCCLSTLSALMAELTSVGTKKKRAWYHTHNDSHQAMPEQKATQRGTKNESDKVHGCNEGLLRPVLRYVQQREASEELRPSTWRTQVQRCWEAARNGISLLRKDGPLPNGVALLPADTMSTSKEVAQMMEALEASVQPRAQPEEKAHVQAWKQLIDDAWTKTRGTVHRWIRGA